MPGLNNSLEFFGLFKVLPIVELINIPYSQEKYLYYLDFIYSILYISRS